MKPKQTGLSEFSKANEVLPSFSRKYVRMYKEGRDIDRVEIDEDTWKMMYQTYFKIGATSELPSSGNRVQAVLSEMYRIVFVDNHRVPDDIPFVIIWEEFSDGLIRGDIERKGNNMGALCQAFNDWITQERVRNLIREVFRREFPERQHKQLQGATNFDEPDKFEINKLTAGKKVEEWPAEAIEDTLKSLKTLSGSEQDFIEERLRAGKFISRVINRAKELGIEV